MLNLKHCPSYNLITHHKNVAKLPNKINLPAFLMDNVPVFSTTTCNIPASFTCLLTRYVGRIYVLYKLKRYVFESS